ncbi:SPOR domain-containing protein [Pseudoroseicyclus aestuarii]|uniref:Sporulation related protein n=1 Tax=Pseudoroseicyclus aestuarii TaxID=1795041 RepID=A0A318TBC3_9RHOB|nr:SPOR domain-containing protein [Pseudoroseicyclus aestuarii]PYE85628.1 sporulation related protein [Pseudoroseicyclus aestuarii]
MHRDPSAPTAGRVLSGASLCLLLSLGAAPVARAQASGPAEIPPESYSGTQFIDSRGCAYVRAGIDGATDWVPRMSRDRDPLCGFQPTPIEAPVEAAEPMTAPDAQGAPPPDRQAAAADPAEGGPSDPVQEAAPAPALNPSPEPRVTAEAGPAAPPPARAAAPRTASPEAGRTARVSPPPQPRAAAPAPGPRAPLTREAFCTGRSGPQPGYVGSRSGQVIDCGPEASQNPEAAPALTLEAFCTGRNGPQPGYVGSRSGRVIDCGPSPAGPAPQAPPRGYRAAWDDGRVNPARGIEGPARAAAAETRPQEPQQAGRYVQIGTYGVPANASHAAARLRDMGLPVTMGRLGTRYDVVLAGPFTQAEALHRALSAARAAGYGDAFIR